MHFKSVDRDNARSFVDQHATRVRFCHGAERWYVLHDGRWQEAGFLASRWRGAGMRASMPLAEPPSLMVPLIREYVAALARSADPKLLIHAQRVEDDWGAFCMLHVASLDPRIAATLRDVDPERADREEAKMLARQRSPRYTRCPRPVRCRAAVTTLPPEETNRV
jgi:hypothetical protein